jgi:hypothetical protein
MISVWLAILLVTTQSCATMSAPNAPPPAFSSPATGGAQSTAQSTSETLSQAGSSGPAPAPIVLSGPVVEQSDELTRYLEHNRLPLVRAEVRRDRYGDREVTLYGFVATPYGKSDAEAKVRRLLDDPSVKIVNAIKVRPELLNLQPQQPAGTPSTSGQNAYLAANQNSLPANGLGSLGSLQSYQAQQFPQQSGSPSGSWLDYLLPVLGIGAIIGLGFIGGGMGGFYPGMGYPFFP